jgi:SP family myo-inositol transporter-like MFS transporter 13
MTSNSNGQTASSALSRYNAFLLLVAGLGGLLYGIDVGIIGSAYPYLEATSGLQPAQLSVIVAAVLLGSVLSTLFAGLLADFIGRKPLMILSGIAFSLSIPIIALSQTYTTLFLGRLLQGVSGGFVGVVVPLYLAECLPATNRGRGTAIFQWLLTLGIVVAAFVGIYFSYRVDAVAHTMSPQALLDYKNIAWRSIFWVSLPPGLIFIAGSFFVSESPRWLFSKGRRDAALIALQRSRPAEQAALELDEMNRAANSTPDSATANSSDSLLRRKYIVPFLLACIILVCNQTTGINSIIGYNTGILLQSGLSDLAAHWGYVIFTIVNFLLTIVGMMLVDGKGRKFLLTIGSGGVIFSTILVGLLFRSNENAIIDVRSVVQSSVGAGNELNLAFDRAAAQRLLASAGQSAAQIDPARVSLTIIYSYGDFTSTTNTARSDAPGATSIHIDRAGSIPANTIESLFKNPMADLPAARVAPLAIQRAALAPIPGASHGWLVAGALFLFMAFFAMGPGVCVWLALSELMPTRIRSNGMSIALVFNQLAATMLATIFLPFVGKHGYSSIFFLFAGCTVVYFITAAFFLPETKGKTLEEIEAHFEGIGTA